MEHIRLEQHRRTSTLTQNVKIMVSAQSKIRIINTEINALEEQRYQFELQCRVFKKTGQTRLLEDRTEMLVTTENQIDLMKEELAAVEKELEISTKKQGGSVE